MEEYWLDLDRSSQICWDLTRSVEIQPNFNQNLAKFRPPVPNPKPPDMHPKLTRPDPKLHTGRLWVPISPTQVCRVESELGTNSTRANLWTPLTQMAYYIKKKKKKLKSKKVNVYGARRLARSSFDKGQRVAIAVAGKGQREGGLRSENLRMRCGFRSNDLSDLLF